jgi:pimeloyl-ACP methyl ester carboxylesterase
MMKRFILILMFLIVSSIFAEPYKPYPIIFVHGLGSNSGTWGASTPDPQHDRSEWICKESVFAHPEKAYFNFLNYMIPIVEEWDKVDSTYTTPTDPPTEPGAFPNKTFLEVVNMDDNVGSVDYDPNPDGYHSLTYNSWAEELYYRVREVLLEYYGIGWETNSEAKVILIGHSTGDIVNCKLKIENCKMKNERI